MTSKQAYPNPRTGQQPSHDCPGCRQLLNQAAKGSVFELCLQCGSVWIDTGTTKPWRYEDPATVPAVKRNPLVRRQA